tara:strand:+ start:134 stop:373 length:240 start_codon:yes stop_codon:yes gene_type:complete
MGIALALALFGALFCADNQHFFETVSKEKKERYEWHFIGPTDLDPKAKSISLKVEGHDPYILWKLKKSEETVQADAKDG